VFDRLGQQGASAALPASLTQDRIKQALAAQDWTSHVDSDGDLMGFWDNNVFYFYLYGEQEEILQVRGRWHQALPIEYRSTLRQVIDDWHLNKIWPKAYSRVDDAGRLWVLTEHSVDWEYGVTDQQLALTLRCAITTSSGLFKELAARFIVPSAEIEQPPEDW